MRKADFHSIFDSTYTRLNYRQLGNVSYKDEIQANYKYRCSVSCRIIIYHSNVTAVLVTFQVLFCHLPCKTNPKIQNEALLNTKQEC